MDIAFLKNEIRRLAADSLIDEVRFIDAEDFGEDVLGNVSKFCGRQPRELFPNARSIIAVSTYIGAFAQPDDKLAARTSRLVLSGYYSNIVKPLAPIRGLLKENGFSAHIFDTETDEKAIPLKAAAVKAGLGWIGKNSLLISEKYGSFQAPGAVITDAPLAENNSAQASRCGDCTRCRDACPTHAVDRPREINRPRCLSDYFETSSPAALDTARVDTQRFFFECDICQNACPFNRKHLATPLSTPFGEAYASDLKRVNSTLSLDRLRAMSREEYEREVLPLLVGFPLPYELFKRNLSMISD